MAGEAAMEDLSVSLARFGTVRLKSDAMTRPGVEPAEQPTYDVRMRYGSIGRPAFWSTFRSVTIKTARYRT